MSAAAASRTSFVVIDRQALQQMGVEWGGALTDNTSGRLTGIDPGVLHFGVVYQNNPLTPLQTLVLIGGGEFSFGETRAIDELLVALRRTVLNDAEHAVGNMLQRMHHAARAATAGMTLSDYLLAEIQQLLATPSLQEWMQKIPRYDDVLDPSPAQIIREERDRR